MARLSIRSDRYNFNHSRSTRCKKNVRKILADSNDSPALYHLREHRQGSFERHLLLPTDVDANKAQADFENGILTVTIPIAEAVKPKAITIKAK